MMVTDQVRWLVGKGGRVGGVAWCVMVAMWVRVAGWVSVGGGWQGRGGWHSGWFTTTHNLR